MLTTARSELAGVAGDVELSHDAITNALCLLIDADEGDEELGYHIYSVLPAYPTSGTIRT